MKNLFGETDETQIIKSLRDDLIIPPFTIIDTTSMDWRKRKNEWKNLLPSEEGRSKSLLRGGGDLPGYKESVDGKTLAWAGDKTSYFDPALAEVIYHWFCPSNGNILDPFCGGHIRGSVASKMGFNYTGVDLRPEQIDDNKAAMAALELQSTYICGDSVTVIPNLDNDYDLVFSCPPYFNLEIYSKKENDLSNMSLGDFKNTYGSILRASASKLKPNSNLVMVLGDVRIDGMVLDLCSITQAELDGCMGLKNKAIIKKPIGTAALRGYQFKKWGNLIRTHEYLLQFSNT